MTHQDIQYTGNSEVMADKEVYRLLKARDTAFRSADSLRAARVNQQTKMHLWSKKTVHTVNFLCRLRRARAPVLILCSFY